MRKPSVKTFCTMGKTLVWGVAILGTVSKVRKDITIHRKHEDHNPCPCQSECIACLKKV